MVSATTVEFWNERFGVEPGAMEMEEGERRILGLALGFFGEVRGRRVLDLGCGLGRNAVALARRGAHVTALDVSEVAIARLDALARAEGLPVEAVQGDAMRIDRLGTFDLVIGSMILHHLEPFEAFADALHRALAPCGKAFFHENNAASRLLVWMRQNVVGRLWVPKYGDPDEFPLTPQEVEVLRARFRVRQDFPDFRFFCLVSAYLLRGRMAGVFDAVDRLAARSPGLRRYSYRQVLMLERG